MMFDLVSIYSRAVLHCHKGSSPSPRRRVPRPHSHYEDNQTGLPEKQALQ